MNFDRPTLLGYAQWQAYHFRVNVTQLRGTHEAAVNMTHLAGDALRGFGSVLCHV